MSVCKTRISGKDNPVKSDKLASECRKRYISIDKGSPIFTEVEIFIDSLTNCLEHRETLGARNIDSQNMFIDSYGALRLIKTYFSEEA